MVPSPVLASVFPLAGSYWWQIASLIVGHTDLTHPISAIGVQHWECDMASGQDFRDYADECLEWAKTAESDRERKIFRQMATTWWNIARLTEEGRSLENLADIFPVLGSRADTGNDEREVA
jgi:hypothetical protein